MRGALKYNLLKGVGVPVALPLKERAFWATLGHVIVNDAVLLKPTDETIMAQFNQIVSENQSKWGQVCNGNTGVYDFSTFSAQIARFPGMLVRHHGSNWHLSIPQVTLGTDPLTTTGAASPEVTVVTPAAHNLTVGSVAEISGAAAVGGITPNGRFLVTAVPTSTSFTFNFTSNATSGATGGGSAVTLSLAITSANYQARIEEQFDAIFAEFDLDAFSGIDAINETFTGYTAQDDGSPFGTANDGQLDDNPFRIAGGANWWRHAFDYLETLNVVAKTMVNDFECGEQGTFWGSDALPTGFTARSDQDSKSKRRFYDIKAALKAGTVIDAAGFQLHMEPEYCLSLVDLKWRLRNLRYIGIEPVITEANIRYDGLGSMANPAITANSAEAKLHAAKVLTKTIETFIREGACKDITFWSQYDQVAVTNDSAFSKVLSLYIDGATTVLYDKIAAMLSATPEPDVASIPRAYRLHLCNNRPPLIASAGTTNANGTLGPFDFDFDDAFEYRDGTGFHNPSQTNWTMDIQFRTQTDPNGDLLYAVDASSNLLWKISRVSATDVVTVTIGGTALNFGTMATNTDNRIRIRKDGNTWRVAANGGAMQTATETLADTDHIHCLKNFSGGATVNGRIITIDFYENAVASPPDAEVVSGSVYEHGNAQTQAQIAAYSW